MAGITPGTLRAMFEFPDNLDDLPAGQRAHAQLPVRYEDVTQDGRAQTLSLPHAIGAAVWQQLLAHQPFARHAQRAGVVPILTRLVIEGGGGPISVRRPLEVEGGYGLAHTIDEQGEVNRLILTTTAVVHGTIGRTHGAPPPNAGEKVLVGRVFGEDVFTRLFAPPAERKVLRFDIPGVEPVPPARYTWRPPPELLALPEGAEPLDDGLLDDDGPIAFGLTHTDSNQHVNSLVYPRLFEDAALRRFAARGKNPALMPRHVEIAYRKPCFAGETVRIRLRAFAWRGKLGAAGAFFHAGADRPACYVRMLFGE